jgi:hypothetical protein
LICLKDWKRSIYSYTDLYNLSVIAINNPQGVIAINNPQGVIAMNNSETVILRALARRIS